jgi:hypothetical protein
VGEGGKGEKGDLGIAEHARTELPRENRLAILRDIYKGFQGQHFQSMALISPESIRSPEVVQHSCGEHVSWLTSITHTWWWSKRSFTKTRHGVHAYAARGSHSSLLPFLFPFIEFETRGPGKQPESYRTFWHLKSGSIDVIGGAGDITNQKE